MFFRRRKGKREPFEFEENRKDELFEGIEKRKTVRISPPLTLKFLTYPPVSERRAGSYNKMEESDAVIKDISLEGARIEVERKLSKGSVIEAQIYSPELEPIEVIALVVQERVKQDDEKKIYHLGLQFLNMDEESRKRFKEYLIQCLY